MVPTNAKNRSAILGSLGWRGRRYGARRAIPEKARASYSYASANARPARRPMQPYFGASSRL